MKLGKWTRRLYRLLRPGRSSRGPRGKDVERVLDHTKDGDWRGRDEVRVIDGDTLKLENLGVTVRLARVDTPEKGEPGAAAATEAVERKLDEASQLDVQVVAGGKYGRAVAEVEVDVENLSDWLLRSGYARRYG